MIKNCLPECPLYQQCQPHFRTVSSMTETAITAAGIPDTPQELGAGGAPVITGVAVQRDPYTTVCETVAAAEVAFVNAQESCSGRKLSILGRMILGLKVHGATMGNVPTREELASLEAETRAKYSKCPSRPAHAAYKMIKRLDILRRD